MYQGESERERERNSVSERERERERVCVGLWLQAPSSLVVFLVCLVSLTLSLTQTVTITEVFTCPRNDTMTHTAIRLCCDLSCRELEAELGVVWEAATREEQGMRETLLTTSPGRGVRSLGLLGRTGPDWLSEASEPPAPYKAHHHSANEVEKLGLDFYS